MIGSFEKDLKRIIKDGQRWARRNYFLAHSIFIISVFGSFTASILASGELGKAFLGEQWNQVTTAFLAALPGLMLLLNNTLRFEERAKWQWRKVRLAERYYRQVRDTGQGVSELSMRFSEESEKLESEWPAFGSSPVQPSKPGS
ncbi:hypothetical protein R6U79_12055 [Pseudomonas putida]|uniref:hypothetical protein n=1 Tax=Pseudomonas putida TaxID=303 RepID=UPI0029DE833E|nr:hypothetical protein [Pseudomonas putida]WPK02941.1 hypothetical protein R6U79_12055 [Pseudomonas putida]